MERDGLLARWRRSRSVRLGIDYLMRPPPPAAPLGDRIRWLVELSAFFRAKPMVEARFRSVLALLEQSAEKRAAVAATLASLMRDLDAIDLLSTAGLVGDLGLGAEFFERLFARVLPHHRVATDFGDFLHEMFPEAEDVAWLERLSATDAARARDVLGLDELGGRFRVDLREALELLASKIRVIGAYEELRVRLPQRRPSLTGFHALDVAVRKVPLEGDMPAEVLAEIDAAVGRSGMEIKALRASLRATGSTLALAYQVHRLDVLLERVAHLTRYLHDIREARAFTGLVSGLARTVTSRHRVRPLWDEVTALVSHRIADANADVGDHYIARKRSEQGHIIAAALGGGMITVATIFGKMVVEHGELPPLLKGLVASAVYAVSFLVIQWLGFTLATKQPAMTAAALARTLDGEAGPGRVVAFAKESIHIVRTQVITILGNLFGVVAGVVVVHQIATRLLGIELLAPKDAEHLFMSHTLLGFTPLFAALTGGMLWASSIATGWVANLLRLRQVERAVASGRRLRFALGESGARRIAGLVDPGVPAAVGNGVLGIFLGFVPKVCASFGVALEARHVTLSSGAVALAVLSGGTAELSAFQMAFVFLGVAVIGLLNLGVSFGLAISVALRARDVMRAQRANMWRAIAAQLRKRPWLLVVPES